MFLKGNKPKYLELNEYTEHIDYAEQIDMMMIYNDHVVARKNHFSSNQIIKMFGVFTVICEGCGHCEMIADRRLIFNYGATNFVAMRCNNCGDLFDIVRADKGCYILERNNLLVEIPFSYCPRCNHAVNSTYFQSTYRNGKVGVKCRACDMFYNEGVHLASKR